MDVFLSNESDVRTEVNMLDRRCYKMLPERFWFKAPPNDILDFLTFPFPKLSQCDPVRGAFAVISMNL